MASFTCAAVGITLGGVKWREDNEVQLLELCRGLVSALEVFPDRHMLQMSVMPVLASATFAAGCRDTMRAAVPSMVKLLLYPQTRFCGNERFMDHFLSEHCMQCPCLKSGNDHGCFPLVSINDVVRTVALDVLWVACGDWTDIPGDVVESIVYAAATTIKELSCTCAIGTASQLLCALCESTGGHPALSSVAKCAACAVLTRPDVTVLAKWHCSVFLAVLAKTQA
jgi:hypothetical protein